MAKYPWTGHDDDRNIPKADARKLSDEEKAIHALADQEGITTAAAAEKLRYQALLSAEDTMNVSAALLPAESEPGADSA